MPGSTVEKEYQRRIAAINAMNARLLFVKQLRPSAFQLQMRGRRSASYALGTPDFLNMSD
ncbi:hypothetical protein EYZ11_011911 [Aspergillus tanneri]|uniref:Uncharacterized protein n=1 Tax=Aspergillus tanneri TaxID=1220188 RepID=A0A4V6RQN1_9EURO|nr:hypothetical protein EYZ11_011911 [Aspergillus tanneri]